MIKINPTLQQINHIVSNYNFTVNLAQGFESYINKKLDYTMTISIRTLGFKVVYINENLAFKLKSDKVVRNLLTADQISL